jgi:hypothetical protein
MVQMERFLLAKVENFMLSSHVVASFLNIFNQPSFLFELSGNSG